MWEIIAGGAAVLGGLMGDDDAAEEQARLHKEQMQFYKGLWGDYKSLYGELEKDFVREASVGLDADFMAHRAAADVRSSFERQRGSTARDLARYGLDPSEGQYQHLTTKSKLDEARAESGGRTRTRMAVGDINFQRKGAALDYGGSTRSAIMGGLSDSTLSLANLHGANARRAGRGRAGLISAGLGVIGRGLGDDDDYGSGLTD